LERREIPLQCFLTPSPNYQMNNKQTADHINSFFSSLTNDFLEVRGDWLARVELDPLPSITDENVAKRLSDLPSGRQPVHTTHT
jgi:hypothetical protein